MNVTRFIVFVLLLFSVLYPHTAEAQQDCTEGPTVVLNNGMCVYEYCTFSMGESPNKIAYMTLAENWTHPVSKMVFAANETISLYENWNLERGYLARDWEYPGVGMILKKGSSVGFYKNGNLYVFTLARDWKNPRTGNVLKGGSDVYLHEDGSFHICTYKHDITLENGMVMKGGRKVYFFDNGSVYMFNLARQWEHPALHFKLKRDTWVSFHKNGDFHQFTPVADMQLPGTHMMLKDGCEVIIKEDGTVYSATFAEPWTDPKTGKVYEAGRKHVFEDE
jgi:predicted heme/steroid binding protein